jgi:hypothetical protein
MTSKSPLFIFLDFFGKKKTSEKKHDGKYAAAAAAVADYGIPRGYF